MGPIHIIVTVICALVLIAFLPWWVDLARGLFALLKDLACGLFELLKDLIELWLMMWEDFIYEIANRGDD